MDGKPWLDRLKNEDYKDAIAEFKQALSAIGKTQGWTLSDLKSRFSNDLFDQLLFDDTEGAQAAAKAGNGQA